MKITVMTADEQIITLDVDPHESVLFKDPSFAFCLHLSLFLIAVFHSFISLCRWKTSKHCSRLRWLFFFFFFSSFSFFLSYPTPFFPWKLNFWFKKLSLSQFSFFLWMFMEGVWEILFFIGNSGLCVFLCLTT